MINRQALLADLQKFLQRIEADLLERSKSTEVPEVPAALRAEYEKASRAERTAQNYEDWRTDTITQAAAAWVLSCVFVRFLEDNSLIDPPKIAGPGERLARARDEHELYFRSHPQHTDREYLLSIFDELAKLPGTRDIFGEHNAINDLPNWLSGDAAGELLNFFQKIDASTGDLVHDFTDPNWDTRFLGDLYQDLSEAARKKFALLQTPDFVEEFILDRTLDPAIEEFGLVPQPSGNEKMSSIRFKMIDPACGSGHFLLGAFPRLLERWQRKEPGTNVRELSQRALDSIHGVDINPFAVAIAKFRLLLVAMKACDIQRLVDTPSFHINVACGDSLLHGENRTSSGQKLWDYAEGATDEELYSHAYPGEDLQKVRTLLKAGSYHCVVANPPYIVPKDRKLNEWYRKRFSTCHMKYSLAVPFMQQIFQLAVHNGFTGQITANSFMKREFGKKLIESFFKTVELTHVVDTAGGGGAYIPGHTTGTVILFGRNRVPSSSIIRTIMGIRGEPTIPVEPSKGLVWTSILTYIDVPGTTCDYISVADSPRDLFLKHPWSIGGGGASELKESLDLKAVHLLKKDFDAIGPMAITALDEAYLAKQHVWSKLRIPSRAYGTGDSVRDWRLLSEESIVWPYNDQLEVEEASADSRMSRHFWPYRLQLIGRTMFGKSQLEANLVWYEYRYFEKVRARSSSLLAFSCVATHNHFCAVSIPVVANRHAPVLMPSKKIDETGRFALLGILNSSIACFWMKQVFYPKATSVGDISTDKGKPEANRYEFAGTGLERFPVPFESGSVEEKRVARIAIAIEKSAREIETLLPNSLLRQYTSNSSVPLGEMIEKARTKYSRAYNRMIALQEELDWECYYLFGITEAGAFDRMLSDETIGITADLRPFLWKDDSSPELVPGTCKEMYVARKTATSKHSELALVESAVFKRPWWGKQGVYGRHSSDYNDWVKDAFQEWLCCRIESYFDYDCRMSKPLFFNEKPENELAVESNDYNPLNDVSVYSIAQLSDAARRDPPFMEVGELYREDPAFDVQLLIEELVIAESVPHLPILCYKDSGLRKRAEWEMTWDLQRREDAGVSVGTIPVPPTYTSADFISTSGARYWSLRGKLDVPKERWISFPHCEGPDGTLVICWAGYDHLQQAQAISAYYVRVQTEFGGSDDPRLIPLLASLIELLPWLAQWHNEPNAKFDGLRMGDYFESFVNEEARNLAKTLAEIKAWVPPRKVSKAKPTKSKKKSVQADIEADE
jgi:hypothetical protein